MSAYNQPTESLPSFNNEVFSQPIVNLSQAEADLLYLSKTKNDISTASSTTFNGDVNVGGMLDLTSGENTSEIFQSATTLTIANRTPSGGTTISNQTPGGANISMITFSAFSAVNPIIQIEGNNYLNAKLIKSTTPTSAFHTLFDNMTTNGLLTIGGTASTNTIRGNTTFPQNVTIGTDGVSNDLSLKGELRCYDTTSPYTTYAKISTSGLITTYEAPNGISTSHMFKTYNSSGVLTGSQFEVTATANISRQTHTFTNRINWSVSSYNFGSFTSNNLGYYLKATGTSQSVTSATPTTILTTSSIPIGVWRIDFSVQLTVGATGAGTITQSQSYLSTTLNGAVGTAVSFTGSTLRSHTSEVYANNDIQVITSSITYNQSTAGVLYLNILRTFGTGTYSFIGEVAITRLA